jgi:inosine/xanthosine triphosphatase
MTACPMFPQPTTARRDAMRRDLPSLFQPFWLDGRTEGWIDGTRTTITSRPAGRDVRVCLGGTFEPFHVGHEALLREAARGATDLFVGITDAALAERPERRVAPWEDRAQTVERFLRGSGYKGTLTIRALRDAAGPAAREAYDAIVVSPETVPAARTINERRAAGGLKPLVIRVVAHVVGQDLLPVSGTAVHAGRVDRAGRRLTAVRVAVGSTNPVKVEAVRQELARILRVPAEVKGFPVPSSVPEQPRSDETLAGARVRARAAVEAWPDCDYAVGIEAGLIKYPGEEAHLEAQACAVVDRTGWETHGWGPAFHYPPWVTERALKGEMVSQILGPVANDPAIGSTTGAIGYLSEGRLDRTGLTRMAVLMAFLPRLRRGLYTM